MWKGFLIKMFSLAWTTVVYPAAQKYVLRTDTTHDDKALKAANALISDILADM